MFSTSVTVSMEKIYPFEFSSVDDDTDVGPPKPTIRVGPKKYSVLRSFRKYGLSFYNFKTTPHDVFIMGVMRSGTTVTQELVWLLCNNLDFEKANNMPMPERFPSLEHISLFDPDNGLKFPDDEVKNVENVWKKLQEEPIGQRLIKTHIPFSLLANDFLESKCLWTPYFEHLKEAWERRNEENLLLLYYNDIRDNLQLTIQRVAEFLDVKITEEEIALLKTHLRSNRFQKPDSWKVENVDEKFKPKENEWKEYFVDELEGEVEDWIKKNVEEIPGFHFA